MAKVVKHAWTHRPRAQGGTDPIEIEAGGEANISAIAVGNMESVSHNSFTAIEFDRLFITPGSGFAAHGGNEASYLWVNLPQEGLYRADFEVKVSTNSFDAGDNPYIEPSCHFGGSADTLAASVGSDSWDNTQGWIGGEQFTTDEMAHRQWVACFWINFTEANFDSIGSFGIGVNLISTGVETLTLGGKVAVVRLGEPLTEVT